MISDDKFFNSLDVSFDNHQKSKELIDLNNYFKRCFALKNNEKLNFNEYLRASCLADKYVEFIISKRNDFIKETNFLIEKTENEIIELNENLNNASRLKRVFFTEDKYKKTLKEKEDLIESLKNNFDKNDEFLLDRTLLFFVSAEKLNHIFDLFEEYSSKKNYKIYYREFLEVLSPSLMIDIDNDNQNFIDEFKPKHFLLVERFCNFLKKQSLEESFENFMFLNEICRTIMLNPNYNKDLKILIDKIFNIDNDDKPYNYEIKDNKLFLKTNLKFYQLIDKSDFINYQDSIINEILYMFNDNEKLIFGNVSEESFGKKKANVLGGKINLINYETREIENLENLIKCLDIYFNYEKENRVLFPSVNNYEASKIRISDVNSLIKEHFLGIKIKKQNEANEKVVLERKKI